MTATTCAVCGRPMVDQALVDQHCASKTAEQLRAIIELAPTARLVAAGLVRRGGGGASSNKPGSRPPLNDGATDALDAITNALTTVAREIADVRGLQTPRDGHTHTDPLIGVCRWLTEQLEWLRHATDDQGGPYALGVFDEIRHCAGRMRRLVDGPVPQRYLGPCGAATAFDTGSGCKVLSSGGWCVATDDCEERCELAATPTVGPCEGDVYARDGAATGRCKTCGTEWSTAERQAWLDGEVRSHAFRAAHIAQAYGLKANTIRKWAERGHLLDHGRDRDDNPLYNVGDVLDLAAADAARRETTRAERERRAAQRI